MPVEPLICTDPSSREAVAARKELRNHVKEMLVAIEKVELRDDLSLAIIRMAQQPASIIGDVLGSPNKVKLIAFLANLALTDIIAEMQSAKTAEGN